MQAPPAPAASVDTPDPAAPQATIGSWWGLVVLVLIGLYVVMDRQIVVLQIEPIRRQLQLSDFQIGMVTGLSVALFTAVVGYPIGWLADRFDRRLVLAGCITVWSVSVGLCGLARDFNELFLASALVGAGEAGLLPIAYALIPDLFRGQKRVLANSMFIVVSRFGVGLVIAACGYLVANVEMLRPWLPAALSGFEAWRLAFIVTALPGIPIVLLVLSMRLVRGPSAAAKAVRDAVGADGKRVAATPVLPFLKPQIGTFGTFYVGLGLALFGYSALGSFLPVIAMRQMGATAVQVGNAMGTATFVATGLGLLMSTLGMKYFSRYFGSNLPVLMLMASSVIGALTSALMLLVEGWQMLFVVKGIQLSFLMAGSMLFPTVLQEMTPAPLRARLVSIIILVNIILSAIAAPVVGAISDQLKHLPNGLLLAAVSSSVVALIISALVLRVCARRYAGTVAAARAMDSEAQPPAGA